MLVENPFDPKQKEAQTLEHPKIIGNVKPIYGVRLLANRGIRKKLDDGSEERSLDVHKIIRNPTEIPN